MSDEELKLKMSHFGGNKSTLGAKDIMCGLFFLSQFCIAVSILQLTLDVPVFLQITVILNLYP